jgi:hypothetical protein
MDNLKIQMTNSKVVGQSLHSMKLIPKIKNKQILIQNHLYQPQEEIQLIIRINIKIIKIA